MLFKQPIFVVYSKSPQLYDLSADPGEKNNVAEKYPERTNELKELLEKVKKNK